MRWKPRIERYLMSDAIFTAYEALDARMKMVDIIANNLANVQTTGFKRDFGHVLEEVVSEPEVNMEVATASLDLTPGVLVTTGRRDWMPRSTDPGFLRNRNRQRNPVYAQRKLQRSVPTVNSF